MRNLLRKGEQNLPILRTGVEAVYLYIVSSHQKIQKIFLDITLNPDIEKVCPGKPFLAVNSKRMGRSCMAIDLNGYRGFLFIQIFRHLQFLKVVAQIEVRGTIDIFKKRFGNEGLDFA